MEGLNKSHNLWWFNYVFQNDHYNFCGFEPTKGPISISIKTNNSFPESISDPKLKGDRKSGDQSLRRTSSAGAKKERIKKSGDSTIELEVIICLVTGTEYHKISESFDQRISGPPAYLDLVKKVNPNLNLTMLQHVSTSKSIDFILKYHDFM